MTPPSRAFVRALPSHLPDTMPTDHLQCSSEATILLLMDTDGRLSSPDVATTILLIDEDNKDRTYYADRLKASIPDCIVLEAKDGQSGLELYKSRQVDCIVTELHLPDMYGFELLVEVVPSASQPSLAVIMLTRSAGAALADLAKTNGAQALLMKRFTSGDELVQAVRKAIAVVGPTRKDRR
jgi:CheY-like chemotaxis protein